jgi:hypothetical protein
VSWQWWQQRKQCQDDSSLAMMIEKKQLAAERESCCRHSHYVQAVPTVVVVAERLARLFCWWQLLPFQTMDETMTIALFHYSEEEVVSSVQ